MLGHRTWKWKRDGPHHGIEKHWKDTPSKKENLLQTNIQNSSGKREITMRKSSLRESRNYDANISYATSANSNGWSSRKDCSKSSKNSESSAAQGGSLIRLRPQWPGTSQRRPRTQAPSIHFSRRVIAWRRKDTNEKPNRESFWIAVKKFTEVIDISISPITFKQFLKVEKYGFLLRNSRNKWQSKIQCHSESKTNVSFDRKQCKQARLPNQLSPKADREERYCHIARKRPTGNLPRTRRVSRQNELLEKGSVRMRKRGGGFTSLQTHDLRMRNSWQGPKVRAARRERAFLRAFVDRFSEQIWTNKVIF